MAQKLQQQLKEVGSKLESPPASKDALIKLLKQAANCLSELEQSLSPSVSDSMQSCLNAFAQKDLLTHQDRDVKVLVATCVCEITRITAPDAPYSDDVLRDIFHLIVGTFAGLGDIDSPSYERRVVILETVAKYRSCVVMLDLECNDLIQEMFRTFVSVISDDHPQNIFTSMQTIMILILDESEELQENLILILLSVLGCKVNGSSMAARRLAMNVIECCAGKLEPFIKQFLVSSLSGDGSYLNYSIDHHEVIYDLYQCAPQILARIIPYITGELLTDKLDIRLKAVQLLGKLFSLPEVPVSEAFQSVFDEFLKRLTDRVVEVRLSVIDHLKNCLVTNPERPEAPLIIKALSDRVLDYDEKVRKKVVAAVYDVACHSFKVIPMEIASFVAERLRDKSLTVKKYTMERLVDLYQLYCLKSSDGSTNLDDCKWIPGKILKCLYDRDFRLEAVELLLCGSLFPPELSVKNRVKHWVSVFSVFDKFEIKAIEQILLQKQRLQHEMQKYLSLRQTYQEDASELHKRIFVCFKSMSRLFNDPMNAEENFQFLNQLKDVNIWKILTILLDPSTSLYESWSRRDELLKILGEKHPLYDFMDTLTLKCSYILFNKEFVKETLSEAAAQHSVRNTKLISSSMNLLTVISGYSPLLLAGCEEDLLLLLKEDNDLVKEGIAHVLAKAGGTIREQLTMASSSVELLLERLCLEGTRKQAKYSVQALAAITKDDGLKSLSVLYKRLVDILEEKSHLPSILQSLGCIAQTAMPIFETREDEITEFITSKILHNSNKSDEVSFVNTEWSEISELCLTKMFGIKTLVKSYIPAKDAHMRPGIEKLLEILQKIFSYGEISEEIRSNNVDKAHMRLASAKAVLRLSRYWDQKITTSLFYWTLRISQDAYAESKKSFLNKVHQYIKEQLLDAKYACAFLLNFNDCHCPEYEECKQSLLELVHMCRQVKMRQLSTQSDLSSAPAYPEYILAYTVHALAHDPSCPNIDECLNVQAFEPIYWRLHLLLSLLLLGDDGKQSGAFPIERKESYYTILSIFHSIKNAKDVVDETKSNALYAICYLGLSILKRLVPDEVQVSGFDVIPLPNMLYRAIDCSNNYSVTDDNKWTWLNSDSVLAHFEALRLKNKKMGDSLVVEDGMVVEENGDDNEVPLGKMMEILRNQGVKKKKKKKKDIFTNLETINSEFDVLGVVREINLESFKQTQDREAIVSDHNCRSGKKNGKVNTEKEISSLSKRQRDAIGFEVLAPTPKRKRSISTNRLNSSKGRKGNTKRSPIQSLLEQSLFEDDRTETDTDLLITYATDISSMKGRKVSDALHVEKDVDSSSEKLTLGEDNKKKDYQSRTSSTKKRKRRSIARLEKCTSLIDQSSESELVGSRIRIWWPLDKRFYQGVVHSYDPGNKKHTILYDDGDVEVLLLSKEKWEIINNTLSAGKQPKSLPALVSKNLEIDRSSSEAKKKGSTTKRVEENSKLVSVSNNNLDLSPSSNDELKDLRIDQSEYDDAKSDGPKDEQVPPASQSEEEVKAEELHESSKEEIESPKLTDAKDDSDNEPINIWRLRALKSI
ncbi:sister chromatid cohesion protein PDS5 homolog A-like [Zingiber officinale]|uniref:sister chromatid cohesion protein PDS5 homolog A-like n=1 Tax=Zingiber officinale TaxID=94328 RepID=UPI001C4D81D6|nr:sister chromatid cohesion protein PDS5 homolog A-like [Zingiber officinale]